MNNRLKPSKKKVKHTNKGYAIFKGDKRLSIYFINRHEALKKLNK